MSQIWNDNTYQGNHIINTDMSNVETNFSCLKSMFSGESTPPNADEAGMSWYETDKKLQKYRNYATSAWLCLLPLDSSQKIWHYRNDAPTGMVIDSAVTDRVLACESTSGSYNLTPGNSVGSWSNLLHTHDDGTYSVNTYHRHDALGVGTFYYWSNDAHTDYQGSTTQAVTGVSATGGIASTWRPAAAVGALLKLDI